MTQSFHSSIYTLIQLTNIHIYALMAFVIASSHLDTDFPHDICHASITPHDRGDLKQFRRRACASAFDLAIPESITIEMINA